MKNFYVKIDRMPRSERRRKSIIFYASIVYIIRSAAEYFKRHKSVICGAVTSLSFGVMLGTAVAYLYTSRILGIIRPDILMLFSAAAIVAAAASAIMLIDGDE